jgi:hypothetical protein
MVPPEQRLAAWLGTTPAERAIVACDDLDELRTATDDHPTVLDGFDLETLVSNRCRYAEVEAVTGAAICAEVSS